MKSFLKNDTPIITTMLKSNNPKSLISEIELSISQGAEAFGFQIETLLPAFRNEECYKKILSAMGDKPAYITCYQRGNVSPIAQSDEELTDELLKVFRCGAKLVDIRGDLFDISENELTMKPKAIEKQKKLIKMIQNEGGEVLMSSHIFKFLHKEEVLKIALEQQERGVDMVKIVTIADNQAELDENFEASLLLKKELFIRSLFLCNGKFCLRHRMFAPILTNSMFLTMENSIANGNQPSIERAKNVIMLSKPV